MKMETAAEEEERRRERIYLRHAQFRNGLSRKERERKKTTLWTKRKPIKWIR
jgi:hypothetical protein